MFFETYKSELIDTSFCGWLSCFLLESLPIFIIKKIGKTEWYHVEARINLICKYVTVTLVFNRGIFS